MAAGIYIHVPFCLRKCPYCDFYTCQYSRRLSLEYIRAVCRNLSALPEQLSVDTVYFGGGTPSVLPPEAIAEMLSVLRNRCDVAQNAEITMEANPGTVSESRLNGWREAGVNRLSIGIQSFQNEILRILGRKHSAEQAMEAIDAARRAGFQNLSVDLMLGLKAQTPQDLAEELSLVCNLEIPHLSVYLLKIEPDTAYAAEPPALADDDSVADSWLQVHDALTEAGFLHYEISNFAKKGFESRHNLKYWQNLPYYGIGPSAHSYHHGVRTAVPPDLAAFCSAPRQREEITEPHAGTEAERIFLGLRTAEGIAYSTLPHAEKRLRENAKSLMTQYVYEEKGRLHMTAKGWLVSNSVLTVLLDGIL